ncbi:SDR family oxidoreductase [Bacillus sp. 31A1R]|uniref:SDR family oxidoreductase n=1 Tax=Robertmurraya mangrovi TaxID=3098077 RepID=A0ABU5IYD7_9BACI|nr:SDR family oxidoreductase [Bacillus sp. 31A1R]MDZ5472185.1 SDR family oxidoreductase [Bacillus sp. 31A1R]
MGRVLVTGAAGNIGLYVVRELVKKGENVTAGVYSMEKAKEIFSNMEITIVPFDFLNTDTFEEALEGVDKVFLVRPPKLAKPKEDMKPFLNAVKEKGIKQIVFVSLMGVEKNPFVPHRKIEDMIMAMGIDYTFLRPSFFMQNLNTTHQEDIKLRNELYMPVGKAKTSFIDTRDIASVAAVCLTENGHLGKSYTLTGSEALDYYKVGEILSEVLNRSIHYKNPGVLEFRKTLVKRGTKKEFANVMTMLYLLTKMKTAEKVTTDTKKLLGRNPITFKEYANDYKSSWC